MPMFNTPSPRRFHYEPRFYDPEKEKWEALKKKYADKKASEESVASSNEDNHAEPTDADLEYFEKKVRQLDRKKKQENSKFGVQDIFRKRKMPKFNYQPRYNTAEIEKDENGDPTINIRKPSSQIKIKRKFDIADDDYMKPVSAGRIMLYALLVCLLLYWIIF